MGDTRIRKYEFLIVLDIKQNNNEQIVFDMFEEIEDNARMNLLEKMEGT